MPLTNQPLTLKKFISESIKEMGPDQFCKKLGAIRQSLYQWERDICLPNAEKMKLIVKMSGGRVTYESMIENYVRAQRKKARK